MRAFGSRFRQASFKSEMRAMNADITLLSWAYDGKRRVERACRWLRAFEARFSRFQALSELSRLNAAAGRPYRCTPALFALVQLSVDLARRSGGIFDPTVLVDLQRTGYDRSFELVSAAGRHSQPAAEKPRSSWREVTLDEDRRIVTLPAGTGIDLGGAAKGWAVDRLAAMLGEPSLVNGGGDVYAHGRPLDAPAWLVGVADPFQPEADLATLRLIDRGVATSSSLRRSWQTEGRQLHHLIDPRSGRPADSDAVQVTAIAASTLLADFHAKVALILGVSEGADYLNREPEVEGLIVGTGGALVQTRELGRWL